MRAALFRQFGDLKNLILEDFPTPEPLDGEVLIAVRASSINPSDVKNVLGKMHSTTLPRIPGRDFAGIIVNGPKELVGQEVWGTGGDISFTRQGAHAEYMVLPKEAVVLKPAALSFEAAGAAGLAFVTAWTAIVTTAELKAGETAVIIGATGTVGSAAVQIAKSRGARVIAAARSEKDYPAIRDYGADEIVPASPAIIDAVQSLTKDRGADVVFDASGMMFAEAIEITALEGRLPIVAASADGKATFNLRTLYRKMLHVTGIDTLQIDASDCAKLLTQMSSGFASGQFKVKSPESRQLFEVTAAYQEVANNHARIVLLPGS